MTFGVLFSTIDTTMQYEMWRGIADYAQDNGIHVVAYVTASHGDGILYHFDTCFDLIYNNKYLDGMILFSAFFADYTEAQKRFYKYLYNIPKHVPYVSVSHMIPDVPAIMTDNVGGIYNAVTHLIHVHGKRKIAFIKGPDGNQEADERFTGYKKALEDNGIPFDERYVVTGDFTPVGGQRAAIELLDVRKVPIDAVAASDDDSAVSMMNLLKSRNILVPADVAVTGFDDDKAAASFIPSISTVKQDFYGMGQACARILHKKIKGEPVEDVSYIPAVFVRRQSCGCMTEGEEKQDIVSNADSLAPFVLQGLLPLLGPEADGRDIRVWASSMSDCLKENPFCHDAFLSLLNRALISYSYKSNNFPLWHKVLDILTKGAQRYVNEVPCTSEVLSALVSAAALISKFSINEERVRESKQRDIHLALQRVASALVLIFDIDTLADELYRLLPEFAFDIALVGLYREPIPLGMKEATRTIETLIGFDGDTRFNMKHNSWNPIAFSDYSSIRDFNFNRKLRKLFFFPLFFREEELGAILLPYDPEISTDTYETLRINIATALKGAELLTKIQTLSITDELTGLLNRRGFFQRSYDLIEKISRSTELLPAIMFMDLDGLKDINDTYGHKEGDKVIAAFTNILKNALRKEDIIGRMGGDEFIVFASVEAKEMSEQIEARLRAKIEEYNKDNPHPYTLSCSIGSVLLEEATKACFETAILSADNVLYEEKMRKRRKRTQ